MEHFFAVLTLVLMLVLLLSACGREQPVTPVPTPGLPYTEDLQAALLTASDLPAGWMLLPDSTESGLDPLPCGATLPDVRMTTASKTFQTADGERLYEAIAAFHPGDAKAWLTALKNGPQCGSFDEGEQDGTPIVGQITQPSFRVMGEQSYSLRLTTNAPTATFTTDMLFIRLGNFIIQIGDTILGQPNLTQTTHFMQQAILDLQSTRLIPVTPVSR